MDPDPDPEGLKIYGSDGSGSGFGSATQQIKKKTFGMLFLKLTCHLHAAQVVDRNGNIGEGHGGRRAAGRLILAARGRGRLHEERGGHARQEVGVGGLVVNGGGHHHGRRRDHAG